MSKFIICTDDETRQKVAIRKSLISGVRDNVAVETKIDAGGMTYIVEEKFDDVMSQLEGKRHKKKAKRGKVEQESDGAIGLRT